MKIDPTCPLYVVRRTWSDEADDYDLHIERCGHPLGVDFEGFGSLDADGLAVEEASRWKVVCELGHVLLMADDDEVGDTPLPLEAVGAVVGKHAAQAQAVDRVGLALAYIEAAPSWKPAVAQGDLRVILTGGETRPGPLGLLNAVAYDLWAWRQRFGDEDDGWPQDTDQLLTKVRAAIGDLTAPEEPGRG